MTPRGGDEGIGGGAEAGSAPAPDLAARMTTYVFGEFTYSASDGLRRGEMPIHLGPREVWLLLQLLEAGGEVVDHQRLRAGLLSSSLAIGLPLYRTVLSLRMSLGDTLRRVVVSVNGKGYRIGRPVEARSDPGEVAGSLPPAWGGGPRAVADDPSPPAPADGDMLVASQAPGEEALAAAAQRLRKALHEQSASPAACSAYAHVLISQMIRGYIRPAAHIEEAFGAVDRALSSEPDSPAALAAKGWLCGALDDDLFTGLKFLRRAAEFEPSSARTAFLRAWLLLGDKKLEDAREEVERVAEIHPAHPGLAWLRAWILCACRQNIAAIEFADQHGRVSPGYDLLWICVAIARVKLGERKLAIQSALTAVKLSPMDWLTRSSLAWVRAATVGRVGHGEWQPSIPLTTQSYVSPFMTSLIYHALGQRDAVEQFQRIARRDKDPWVQLAWCDPRLNG